MMKLFNLCTFAVVSAFTLAGCAKPDVEKEPAPAADAAPKHDDHAGHAHDDHSGWWCVEHGIPEEQCGMCDAKLAAEFREKGDWCDEHNRPDSQCFTCHPENAEKYAALYEAKFGEAPPKPTE